MSVRLLRTSNKTEDVCASCEMALLCATVPSDYERRYIMFRQCERCGRKQAICRDHHYEYTISNVSYVKSIPRLTIVDLHPDSDWNWEACPIGRLEIRMGDIPNVVSMRMRGGRHRELAHLCKRCALVLGLLREDESQRKRPSRSALGERAPVWERHLGKCTAVCGMGPYGYGVSWWIILRRRYAELLEGSELMDKA